MAPTRSADTKTPVPNAPSSNLSPFEKIKRDSDRKFAHGHPVILPAPFGEFGPVFDVFAFFQNAVRKQVLESYNMLEVLLRFKYEVTHLHTDMFFDWFDTFEDVVLVLLQVEDSQIFPFLHEQGVILPECLLPDKRRIVYEQLEQKLEKVAGMREAVSLLPPGECIPKISGVLTEFLNSIIQYYNVQTRVLPRIIFKANIDGEAENAIWQRFINALRAKHNYSLSLPFVAHWLSPSQLKAWKAKFLGPMLSVRFEQWCRKYEATHGSVPQKMSKVLSSDVLIEDVYSPRSILFFPRTLYGRKQFYSRL